MQLAKKTGNMTMGGDIASTNQFKIAMNAKMFDVLSNSMYEDKIGSIIREISSNALDGHTKAGCPEKPFTIHVPNAIEPWFSVRDEGVGMSDEDIMHVYSTYGESTKDQSNDEIGAFGLGSKTPFAYTDQFTVISINGGVKRTYTATRGNDGLPSINLLAEEQTTEHAGVEVSIAVNKHDIDEFRKKIFSQLKFFKVKPTLINNMDKGEFADLTQNITYQSDAITVYSGVSSYYSNNKDPVQGLWVVQGGVGYKLNLEHLEKALSSETESFASALESQNAYIVFPIGDIAVTANREGISYEPHTVDAIARRLTEVAKEMTAEVHTKLKKEKSLWNRVSLYNEQMNVMQRAIKNLPDFGTLFEGADISRTKMVISINPLNDAGFNAVWMAKYEYSPRTGANRYSYITKVKRKVVGEASGRYSDVVTLEPMDDVRVFIRDTNSKPMARIQMLCDDEDYPSILVVESKTRAEITDADKKKIAKLLHISVTQIEKLSDLPAPKVTRTGAPADKRPRAFQYDGKTMDSSRDWTALFDEIDDIEDAIYVPMERHSINYYSDKGNGRQRYALLLAAVSREMIDKPIIAVNMQTYQRIQDGKIGAQHQHWDEAVQEVVDKMKASVRDFTARSKYVGFQNGIGRNGIIQKIWATDNSTVDILNRLDAVNRRVEMLEARIGEDITDLMNRHWDAMGVDMDAVVEAREAGDKAGRARTEALMQKYPMLKHIGYYPDDEALKEAINYMKLVDGA